MSRSFTQSRHLALLAIVFATLLIVNIVPINKTEVAQCMGDYVDTSAVFSLSVSSYGVPFTYRTSTTPITVCPPPEGEPVAKTYTSTESELSGQGVFIDGLIFLVVLATVGTLLLQKPRTGKVRSK